MTLAGAADGWRFSVGLSGHQLLVTVVEKGKEHVAFCESFMNKTAKKNSTQIKEVLDPTIFQMEQI